MIESIALIATALIALATFIWSVFVNTKSLREKELRDWQSTVIQKFLSSSGRDGASISNILQWYRSEASAYSGKIGKSNLTEAEVRRILIEMRRMRVVEQVLGDKYRLELKDLSMDQIQDTFGSIIPKMLGMQQSIIGDHSLQRIVYGIVSDAPFKLTISDLALKIYEECEDVGSTSDIKAAIHQDIAKNRLALDESGYVGFGAAARLFS